MKLRASPKAPTPSGLAHVCFIKGTEADLEAFAPQYRVVNRRWLRPSIEDDSPPPTPLITWWAALFTLSALARYHPLAWVSALDLDFSPVATTLDRVLRKAMDSIPQLVFEALLGYRSC